MKRDFSGASERSIRDLNVASAEKPEQPLASSKVAPSEEPVLLRAPKEEKPFRPESKPTEKKKVGRKPLGDKKKQQVSVTLSASIFDELKPILEANDVSLGSCLSEYIEQHVKHIKKYYKDKK